MKHPYFIFLIFWFSSISITGVAQTGQHTWGDWKTWGDTGNGTYTNPILPADYSDIDCVNVGATYYAISSTFQFSPGVIILQSQDMVNWSIAGHAVNNISAIGPDMNWDKMNRYGKGIWAGAIRYHDHKFWIYFGTPDEGYFMTTAPTAAGPWQPVHLVLNSKGWDDCCPFWDDDGQGYLVGTNYSDTYKIHLFKLTADGKEIVPGSDKVIHQSRGSEANKLYKINGLYYHLFSEVKPEGRTIMMERSKKIYGPYDDVKQLNHAEKVYKEPNQGGLLQADDGSWYFLTHHGSGDWSGRVMSLLPVTWQEGWPIIGEPGADGIGHMSWTGKIPLKAAVVEKMQTSDDFIGKILSPQWEWNYQPQDEKWSLKSKPGWLRLQAFKPLAPDNLLKAGNTLTQRVFRTENNEVIVKIDIGNMADGEKAGLCHFASPHFATLGVVCDGGKTSLEFTTNGTATNGESVTNKMLWLKSTWGLNGLSQFYYSTDGVTYKLFGTPYQLAWGSYRGDRIGIYNYNNKTDSGYIDVDYLHYSFSNGK